MKIKNVQVFGNPLTDKQSRQLARHMSGEKRYNRELGWKETLIAMLLCIATLMPFYECLNSIATEAAKEHALFVVIVISIYGRMMRLIYKYFIRK